MHAQKKYGFEPDYAVPPGNTLSEVQESLGMTQKELAIRLDMTVQSLNRIIKGQQPITYETAEKLGLVTGVPSRFWNNLEAQYQEQLAKLKAERKMEAEAAWLKSIPVKELVDRGLVGPVKNSAELMREVLRFYGVSSVSAWEGIWKQPAVAARRSSCFESRPGAASAWLRQGELQAQQIECAPFDRQRFREVLAEIRGLTRKAPDVFVGRLRELCASAGVAVALVPEMKKVPWNGATKWLTAEKAMVLLSLRGKGEDIFWFSFFHEASHVLNDSKKDMLINDGSQDDWREVRANEMAAEFLVPAENNERIRRAGSKREIVAIARQLDVSPGIVAGRYRFLTQKWGWFKDLTRHFEWK